MKLNVVILAAGKGTRMRSAKPKVLHEIAGKTLLQHVLDGAHELDCDSIQVVIGHESDEVKKSIDDKSVNFVLQEEQLGTAHAVHQTLEFLDNDALALVLYGDVPLIKADTLSKLLKPVHDKSMAVLTCKVGDPKGLGRIVRDKNQKFTRIVEEKDASLEEKKINEINSGIMAMPVARLHEWLPRVGTENAQKEYYLTDLVELALEDYCEVYSTVCEDENEVTGINDRIQLSRLERVYQRSQAETFMAQGVTMADPARVDFRGDIEIGQDSEIDINVVLEGKVRIGSQVKIGPGCVLKNCSVGDGTEILAHTVIDDAKIGNNCNLGPFARIRPGTEMEESSKAGNFVEIKKSHIGKGSKVNHLTYIGDSNLGEGVNVGAGTITCNYDGINKHKTNIGNNVFIGSNSTLVAPLTIEDGSFVGAGSTLTKNVESEQLAIARSKQNNIAGWKRPRSDKDKE